MEEVGFFVRNNSEYIKNDNFVGFNLIFFVFDFFLLSSLFLILTSCTVKTILNRFFYLNSKPLDLTTKRAKPKYARSHIQHFSTLPQKKGHYTTPQKKGHYTTPECHTLQTAAEDAADPVGIDMTGARLSPDWGEDHRARYYDINRHSILDFSLGKEASRVCRPPSRDAGEEEEEEEKDAIPSLHRHGSRDNSQAHTSLEGTTRSVLREGPAREGLYCELEGVRVSVLDSHLWMAFNEIQTEMIINRGGRLVPPPPLPHSKPK